MAQPDCRTDKAAMSAAPNLNPTALLENGTQRVEEALKLQTEFLGTLQEINQGWFDRAKAEADLASEFIAKLTAARSIPDAVTASQDWASRRMELLAEDGRHVFSDAQKIAAAGARFSPNGWGGSST
jgi:hypothetical protein